MRLVLMSLQLGVLLLIAGVAALIAAALGMFPALGAGSMAAGPAILGAWFGAFMAAALVVIVVVGYVLPSLLVASSTLALAFFAGFRYLRWMRFLGVFANLAGAGLYLLPYCLLDDLSISMVLPILAYPAANILLFLLLPKRPNVPLTRRFATLAVPALGALPVLIFLIWAMRGDLDLSFGVYGAAAVLIALHAAACYYVFGTIRHTATPDIRLGKRLALCLVFAAVITAVVFPLGIFLTLAVFLVLGLAEMALLYPVTVPPNGGWLYWTARTLGRLPAGAGAGELPDQGHEDARG